MMRDPGEPSARVRLEVAFLDADRAAPSASPKTADGPIVLVVARDADVRRYVRECLRERPDLTVIEAATTNAALAASSGQSPHLVVVDEDMQQIVDDLTGTRAIILLDEVPYGAVAGRVRILVRPFSAEALLTEIALALG